MISKGNYISDLMYEDEYLEYHEALEMWACYEMQYRCGHTMRCDIESAIMTRDDYKARYRPAKKPQHFHDALIDDIYDDFESRTCENCTYSEDIEKSYERCEELGINVGRDFGCSLFKRKAHELC